jgi:phage shock protein PspC (stress-responsive transcriptional regulator)
MNKIITINISGIVFSIDEQAYDMLRAYIERLRVHFSTTDGGNEIINDIEGRIAELLQSRLVNGKQFIADIDVQEVMAVMGDPSQMDTDEQTTAGNSRSQSNTTYTAEKRLFRNPDDRILGGVCSGLGAYFGIEQVWIRLAFAFAFFFAGSGLLLYIILWIVIPEAKTTADKLQMRGERVDISNIEKKIKDEFKTVEESLKNFAGRTQPRAQNAAQKIVHLFATILIGFAKLLTRVLGFFITLLAVIFFFVSVLLLLGVSWPVSFSLYPFFGVLVGSQAMFVLGVLGFVTLVVIPLIYMVYVGIKLLFALSGSNKMFRTITASSFGIGITLFFVMLLYMLSQFAHEGEVSRTLSLRAASSDTLYVNVKALSTELNKERVFSAGEIQLQVYSDDAFLVEKIDLQVNEAKDGKFALVQTITSHGSSVKDAEAAASLITPQATQHDSGLVLPSGYLLPMNSKYRKQEITYTLLVPKGKTVVFEDGADAIYGNSAGISENTVWQMTEQGFTCVKCRDDEAAGVTREGYFHRNFDISGFKGITAEGIFEVNIIQGNEYAVNISASEMDLLNNVLINMSGDQLRINMDQKLRNMIRSMDGGKIIVQITTPELNSLRTRDAVHVYMNRWSGKRITIESSGVSEVEVKDLQVNTAEVDVSGAASVKLEGTAQELEADASGTSGIVADELRCSHVDADASGAASISTFAQKSMNAEASGTAHISYKGTPVFKQKKISGAAAIDSAE